MSVCAQSGPSYDICPTAGEIVPQLLALLPRGRAWGTHDGGPYPGSTAYKFWYAVAVVLAWFNAATCAMLLEFFCATTVQLRDAWLQEYGLPDGCDPYPDLCTKVAALGGNRCDYYTGIAARAGWAITCTDLHDACGAKAGHALCGTAVTGKGLAASTLVIRISLSLSPAFIGGAPVAPPSLAAPVASPPVGTGLAPPLTGRAQAGGFLSCFQGGEAASALAASPQAGCFQAGEVLGCPGGAPITPPLAGAAYAGGRLGCIPDFTGIVCLIERVIGAHNLIIYEAIA